MHATHHLHRWAWAAAIAVSICAPAWAQQQLIAKESTIGFTSKQMGVAVEGHFQKFDAKVSFNPQQLATSQIAMTIDMASATLGSPETDKELVQALWFNTAKFPQAQFQSTSITAPNPRSLQVTGKLRIKGVEKTITIPVQLEQKNSITTARGQFTLERIGFKVGEQEWADTSLVANDVQVRFQLQLSGIAPLKP